MKKQEKLLKIASDQPTALIAPSDYEHVFTAKKETPNKAKVAVDIEPSKQSKLKIPSDQPTALIAPPDYEHVFTHAKPKVKQKVAVVVEKKADVRIPSDVPTVLIAPADYEHVFCSKAKTPVKAKAPELAKNRPSPLKAAPATVRKTPTTTPKAKASQIDLPKKVAAPAKVAKEGSKSSSEKEVLPAAIENLVNNFISKQPKQYTINN